MHKPSHIRKEKNCLNCNAEVNGVFCPECGQPNREPVLGIKDLLDDFIHMMTHFDGKFFSTVRMLITKPGYLSKAFLSGQRMKYLPPVQMYVLTSAIFFFFFKSIVGVPSQEEPLAEIEKKGGSRKPLEIEWFIDDKDSTILNNFNDIQSYEKYQSMLEEKNRDGFIRRHMIKKAILINADFQKNPNKTMGALFGKLTDNFSKLLIVSLPFMALILTIVFFRRKNLTFVSHLVFVIHFYVFVFLALLLSNGLTFLNNWTSFGAFGILANALIPLIFLYGFLAIKNFYSLTWIKGLAQYGLLLTLCFLTIVSIFIGYIFIGLIFY